MASQLDIITTSLEALIQRATSVSNQGPDTAAIEAFCGLINREPECAQTAAKFITAKVHSLQEWEALQALLVLETCMKKCGSVFHSEVGKFRFLNELIKLVSPKYLGAHTPEPVRRRVLELMYTWTIQYPKEVKIKEAYEMLKKQGVVKEEPQIVKEPNTRQQASILQDEEKSQLLQKLLQSKNPQDLQAANRLIKSMVKEEERRVEEKWRHTVELATVVNNCRLLNEMLDSYQEGVTNDQELELIKELHSTCHSLRPVLFKLANSNTEADFCHDVLTANDELGEVFTRYNQLIEGASNTSNAGNQQKLKDNTSLLDLTPSPSKENIEPEQGHLEQLSGLDLSAPIQSKTNEISSDNLSVLSDVFNDIKISTPNINSPKPHVPTYIPLMGESFRNSPPLMQQMHSQIHGTLLQPNKDVVKSKGLDELDLLSETLLKETLSSSKANSSNTEILQTASEVISNSSNIPDDEGSLLSIIEDDNLLSCNLSQASNNDSIASSQTELTINTNSDITAPSPVIVTSSTAPATAITSTSSHSSRGSDLLPLGEINITLQEVKPSNVPPFQALVDRNGISTAIHLAKDCPRSDVAVFVVTTSNKNQYSLSNFLFQPVVPKCCRLRLLTPSSNTLPAHNPFLPPSAITQIMLIASPTKDPITLKFVVSYTMDEETITEMGEIDKLLLAEK